MTDDYRELQLLEEQLDYIYIYPEASEKEADEVMEILTTEGITGRKYNEFKPFEKWFLNHSDDIRKDLYRRSTLVLFHVDNNLSEDKKMINFKNETIAGEIDWPKQNIIPIWYVIKGNLSEEAREDVFGLGSLNGMNPHTAKFGQDMKDLLGAQQFATARDERKHLQAKELEKYQLEKREELQKKMQKMTVNEKVVVAQATDDDGATGATGIDQRMVVAQATDDDGATGATGIDQRMLIAQATDDDGETLNKQTSGASDIDQRKDDGDDEDASN